MHHSERILQTRSVEVVTEGAPFCEWLLRRGHRVVRTASGYWYDAAWKVYQAFPYHKLICPNESEVKTLLTSERAIALRYSSSFTGPERKLRYHVIQVAPVPPQTAVPRKIRQELARGFRRARIERISLELLSEQGWEHRQEALTRQGRNRAENQQWWRRLCTSAIGLPGFEAWGAFDERGALVGSLLAYAGEECYTLLEQQTLTRALHTGVNGVLFYTAIKNGLETTGLPLAFLAHQSLDAPDSVDNFKFGMGYSARPVRQRVVFHPALQLFCKPALLPLLRKLRQLYPSSPVLAKGEGLLRFAIEGQKPLNSQELPSCLGDLKGQLMEQIQ